MISTKFCGVGKAFEASNAGGEGFLDSQAPSPSVLLTELELSSRQELPVTYRQASNVQSASLSFTT